MSEQLGKIEKPFADEYRAGRKLYFVPLLFIPVNPKPELEGLVNMYWGQIDTQMANLESKLSKVTKVYHELISTGGQEGVKSLEELNKASYQIVKARLDKGAELHPIETVELFTEFMDWSKCMAVGLDNPKVFDKVWEFYSEAKKKREEYISKQIDESLKPGEAGILLMREGHAVQFPNDIQVFYVSPPALDEIKRWFRERERQTEPKGDDASQN
ncbi:MAG: hypothetical protein Q7R34_10175 [Dehalococcoidia bacterium]|nr:hypothetical protein [Dehalococcoidia bacterium]